MSNALITVLTVAMLFVVFLSGVDAVDDFDE